MSTLPPLEDKESYTKEDMTFYALDARLSAPLPSGCVHEIKMALTDLKLGYLSGVRARLVSVLEHAHEL